MRLVLQLKTVHSAGKNSIYFPPPSFKCLKNSLKDTFRLHTCVVSTSSSTIRSKTRVELIFIIATL